VQKQTIHQLSPKAANAEEVRLQEVYSKRQGDDVRYSWFNPGHLFIIQERERRLLALLSRYGCAPLNTKKILEVGCGSGYWLREFIKWGARPENITGIDLLDNRIVEARQLCPAAVMIQCGSAARLALPDAILDLIIQSTVFTSILDSDMKQQIASEMLRVLKSDGLIVWYDYHVNNPWNPDVRGVKKKEIRRLFPDCRIELKRITLAPPLARWIAPRSWLLAYLLERIPLLCTHYIGIIRK
jgi:ubiquinone/menaquinone biosynthesis C-methylase UbiE